MAEIGYDAGDRGEPECPEEQEDVMAPSKRIPHDVLCKLNITRGFECDCIRSEVAQLEAELEMYERDETFGTLAIQLTQLEAKLQDARIDKANAEKHRDNTFAENKALREAGIELVNLMEDVVSGDYEPDSFTTQPMRVAIDALSQEWMMKPETISAFLSNATREDKKQIVRLEAENETYKHEVSVLRQLLDDDGTIALKAIEQQEGEITALKEDRDRIREDLNAMYEWLAVEFPQAFASLKLKVLNPEALLTGGDDEVENI